MSSRWRPGPVAWGVVGLYLLVIIEGSSLIKERLSYGRWWRLHLMSYVAFAAVSVHALSAGTDLRRWLPVLLSMTLGALMVGGCFWRHAHEQGGVRSRLGTREEANASSLRTSTKKK